jgi:vacuolar iron transporter family protein
MPSAEVHFVRRGQWLRAAVLGANDGIISTASLIVGVAAAAGSRGEILTAAFAGLTAGAMSMAAGEYVSVSSQADSEAGTSSAKVALFASTRAQNYASWPRSTSIAASRPIWRCRLPNN